MSVASRWALAGVAGGWLVLALGVACGANGSAQTAEGGGRGGRGTPIVPDDTASLGHLLRAVRGVDPLMCELATRSVDQHGSWSRWGALGGDPLETDTASAALIRWIQETHNDPAVVPRLRTAIRDGDACVRRVAASFLSRVEHPSATTALMDALGDTRAEVREVAAYGVGMAEFSGAVDELIRRLKDASAPMRRAAAWALGTIEDKRAEPSLLEVLSHDGDARVRQAAAWAIGNMH